MAESLSRIFSIIGVSLIKGDAFVQDANSPYFVDKSLLIGELIPRIETNANYICITRPRRFGKTVAANMLAAFSPGPVIPGKYLVALKFQILNSMRIILVSMMLYLFH